MSRALGRYELLQPIAKGGMAEVFLARRRGPAGVDKRVVIKRIRPERAGDPRFLQMFVREARLSMSLAHENIVPVFDFGRIGDELFLAMEHVDGRDLDLALTQARIRRRPIDPVVVAHIGVEACQALDYAHKKRDEAGKPLGVVHRDITPRNVLLSYSGEVKLVDFGVAHIGGAEESSDRLRGTPAFMAPEQARGQLVDARTDLFALGLVLWEALAGRRAYQDDDREGLLARARLGEVPPLPEDVPEVLREILTRATAREPAARFPDARTMQVALDGYVVSARAAAPGSEAPSHRLAAWLRELFPEEDEPSREGTVDLPPSPIVTFLDDGEAKVVAGDAEHSPRSAVETLAESASVSAAPERRRARWPWFVVAAAVAAGGGTFLLRESAAPVPAPVLDANPVPEAAPVPDASPAPDAAPVPDAPAAPDALPAPIPVRKPGTVQVITHPWAEVTVLGQRARCAQTPCSLSLPPGRHTLRLRNPHDSTMTKTIKVDVKSGQETTVDEKL